VLTAPTSTSPVTSPQRPERPYRLGLRFLIALAFAALVAGWWWSRQPRQLDISTDILGYPTFANFDYTRTFTAYRLIVYVVPGLTALGYLVLARWGALRRPDRPPRPQIPLTDAVGVVDAEPAPTEDAPSQTDAGWPGTAALDVLQVALRLVVPAGVVALGVSTRTTTRSVTEAGIVAGLLYLIIVGAVALLWAVFQQGDSPLWPATRRSLAIVNGVAGAVAAVLALWSASSNTSVHILSDNRVTHWRWLPAWLAIVGVLAVIGWAAWQLRRRVAASLVEYRLLSVIVGSVAVFLFIAGLPGGLGHFQGFDDAQAPAGAALLSDGLFPWRDLSFIHGLWPDVLRTTFGFAVFGDSRWGATAGDVALLSPICWVSLYLLVVWLARGNGLFVFGFVAVVLSGQLGALDLRFVLVPVTAVLLGETLRRRGDAWTAALTFVLFAQAVLVPETSYLVASSLLVVVLCDVVHRVPGDSWLRTFRRTIGCAVTGAILLTGFAIFLLATDALRPFIDYYLTFGPGHDASGAIPSSHVGDDLLWVKFVIVIGLVILTAWTAIARYRARRGWSSRQWVTLAFAGFVALYAEKPLGRLDTPHLQQFLSVALALVLMWLAEVFLAADRMLRSWWQSTARRPLVPMRHPVTALAAVAVVVMFIPTATPFLLHRVPSRLHAAVLAAPTIRRLGYVAPGSVSPALLNDFRTLLTTYAGPSGAVFDLTNSPGYFYYLLGREPGTRYYHVSMAVPTLAQNHLVDELRRSRPPVVIFDSTTIGLGGWDGLSNNVRHYIVSQYVLDGWTPIVRSHGVTLMLRDDLLAHAPALPTLDEAPVTTDLYFRTACSWGDTPNFYRPTPAGPRVDLPVQRISSNTVLTMSGWAADPATTTPAKLVVLASGRTVLSASPPSATRSDVAQSLGQGALHSGFEITVPSPGEVDSADVLALTSDGKLHPLGRPRPGSTLAHSLRLPDGRTAQLSSIPALGAVDDVKRTNPSTHLGVVAVPPGVRLADFQLAAFDSGHGASIGPSDVWLADDLSNRTHRITAHALRRAGSNIAIRVGSCPQWHGYVGQTLYISQSGGTPIARLELSGVR
jgi:hypothetical protein